MSSDEFGPRLLNSPIDLKHLLGLIIVGSLVVLVFSVTDWTGFLSRVLRLQFSLPPRIFVLIWFPVILLGLPALAVIAGKTIKYRKSCIMVLGLSYIGFRVYSIGLLTGLLSGNLAPSYVAETLAWDGLFAGSLMLMSAAGPRLSRSNHLDIAILLVALTLWFGAFYLRGGLIRYLTLLAGGELPLD